MNEQELVRAAELVHTRDEIKEFLATRIGGAVVEFDVTLKAVSDAVESCARIADKYADNPASVDAENIAKEIRSGK